MEYVGTRRVYAAGDLVDFIACGHLAALGRSVAAGERVRPAPSEEDRLVARKGDAHEVAYLERLKAAGVEVVEIARAGTFEGRRNAAAATLAAMHRGAAAIHGATFVDVPALGDGWLGVADFAIRTEGASNFGDYHYEIWDAKLARTAKPSAIVQMCVYSELLAGIQGTLPGRVHVILGDGRIEPYKTEDALPYVRAARERFVERMRSETNTYPDPVAQCARCRWLEPVCVPRRRADDHLSLVAGVRRSQIVKLHAGGIDTVAALAAAPDTARPRKLDRGTFARVRAQAALQASARVDGGARYELLQPQERCGFARLPEADPGDLYFDMEGDPFYDGGLEYLFGVASIAPNGERRFDSFDGHDRLGEKRAFEAFVDFVGERRALRPQLHVYHYAAYEESALKRLAAQHGTREREVDAMLREGVLVDLYDVVRQALRASFESYSLKKIEHFYRGARKEEVTSAMGSVVMYERYLETRDAREFAEIVAYNREDCYSTLELHRWLLDRRAEAETLYGVTIPWHVQPEAKAPPEDEELEGLAASLAAGIDPETADADERARWLAAQLLVYHRREAKPAWWAFFDRLGRTPEDLVDDHEAIGELTPLDEQPELFKQSQIFTFAFPAQEHKLKLGDVFDPELGKNKSAGTLVSIDDDRGTLRLARGRSLLESPLPRALVAGKPIQTNDQRRALARFGAELLRDDCATRFRAARDLLRADAPRLRDRPQGATLDDGDTTPEKLAALTLELDRSYLFVQGPPGAGKTHTGARAIVTLLERGLRVGIAATGHKAIHHLLAEIERVAATRGVVFAGLKKSSKSTADSAYASVTDAIRNTEDVAECSSAAGVSLVAGTAWLFSNEAMEESLDVLAIDEAGQVSLADAIAMSTSAKNVLLLGDPMQLAQVGQGQHPRGAGASVLAHLLGDRATVPPARGLFLPHTFRMHPKVCGYISALAYDGRLEAAAACALRRVDAGTIGGAGLRYLPVAHEGNVQTSLEEAEAIASAVDELLERGTVTDQTGATKPLGQRDVLVVTPYNAQVRRVRSVLDERGRHDVRVGTVDKFQGQEAPVVFFTMASSRGDELPRGVDFLFDRHRVNVAISRAQALAVLVCAPALLETQARTVEALATIGALCRLTQEATPLRGGLRDPAPEQLGLLGFSAFARV
ncbi:MAG: TM0106 family RecB-like putative nuclease [Candidatus Eremiobacteraeota bacterium]|nr:TM0106 family RecB-like putative nuclease [Candidatus Eremiobacteraeota bacterium]